jgi:hypothetical protein
MHHLTDGIIIVAYCIYIIGQYSVCAQCMHNYTVYRVILIFPGFRIEKKLVIRF